MFEKIITKVKDKRSWIILWRMIGGACILAMPVVSFVLFETVTGNLLNIKSFYCRLNIMWYYAVYLILFGITGTSRLSVPLASVFFYVFSLADTFVELYRGMPIMPSDILATGTVLTVVGQYDLTLKPEMVRSGLILLILNMILFTAPVRVKGWRVRLASAIGCLGGAVAIGASFYLYFVPGYHMTLNLWEVGINYTYDGYMLTTALLMTYLVQSPPSGYSQAKLNSLYEEITRQMEEEKAEGNGENAVQPVNVICIMNESLSDLGVAGEFTVNEEYFPFLNSLTKNTVRGSLCVPVYGSGTSNTEYEFLTGNAMAYLPVGTTAYQFYVKEGCRSLVSTMKSQGYETVAMHPYPAENWNRNVCYSNMGFDTFFAEEYYANLETLRTYITDRADYQKIIELVEDKENPDDRLFVFNVTMQNHGGYLVEDEKLTGWADIHLTGDLEGKYPMADQYLSLMKISDEALEGLLGYFENYDEPTMIVMFGDHQPAIEDEFYDDIAGMRSVDVPMEEHLMWYETPFIIWTNYEQPSENMGRLSAIYLSSKMLDLAHLDMSPYQYFLLRMSETLPVAHKFGFYTADGSHYEWEEGSTPICPYCDLILDYECMEFNHSMDKNKANQLFDIVEK